MSSPWSKRRPRASLGTLIPLTVLVVSHLILHWRLEKITPGPFRVLWYIVIQGLLAFIISWLAGSLGFIFALFMGLLGEAVGLLGLTRRGLLAGGYYLVLLLISIVQFSGWGASVWLMLGTIPIVIFVVIYVTLYMRQNGGTRESPGTRRGTGDRQPAIDGVRRPCRGSDHCQ